MLFIFAVCLCVLNTFAVWFCVGYIWSVGKDEIFVCTKSPHGVILVIVADLDEFLEQHYSESKSKYSFKFNKFNEKVKLQTVIYMVDIVSTQMHSKNKQTHVKYII